MKSIKGVPSLAQLQSPKNYSTILAASSKTTPEDLPKITISASMDGERRMESSTGLFVTLGAATGEKEETSGSLEASITSELRLLARGQLQEIPGPRMFAIKPSPLLKSKSQGAS